MLEEFALIYMRWPAMSVIAALACALLLAAAADRLVALPASARKEQMANGAAGLFWRSAVYAYVFAFFFALAWRPVYACLAAFSFFLIFAAISRAKYAFIREPLVFSDLALAVDAVRYKELFYTGWLNWLFWIAAAGYVFGVSALVIYIEPPVFADRLSLARYAAGWFLWLAPLVALALAPRPVASFASRLLGNGDPVRATRRLGAFGHVLTGFLAWLGAPAIPPVRMPAQVQAGFDVASGTAAKPIVLVWQSESFVDMRRHGVESLALPNFDALAARAAARGRLVNAFPGGYTMRTEFAVLTGLGEDRLGPDRAYPYLRAARYREAAWPARLKEAGWKTHFVHPYEPTFFRRHRAIPALGFDEMTMLDAFEHTAAPCAPYVGDPALARRVAEMCAAHEAETPLFMFVASMGNHGPWQAGRVAGLSDPLAIYCRLLEEADLALRELAEKCVRLGRPVWLAFYGDHVPLLKSFADPFPDAATDYLVVELGEDATPTDAPVAQDLAAEHLIARLGEAMRQGRHAGAGEAR